MADRPEGRLLFQSTLRRWTMSGNWEHQLLIGALCVNLAVTLIILPGAGQPYDFIVLTGGGEAFLKYGFPLFYHWKFGAPLALLSLGVAATHHVLSSYGIPGPAAIHVAWKLPLVVANLFTAVTLGRIAARLNIQRPHLITAMWMLNPVAMWVAAGHGQVEAFSILAVVGSLALLIRGKYMWAGVVIGLGVSIEYFPILVMVGVAASVLTGRLRVRDALTVALGVAIALLAAFGPVVLTAAGRNGLSQGLGSNISASGPASVLSLWGALGLGAHAWLFIAIPLIAGVVLSVVVLIRRGWWAPNAAAVTTTGLALVLIVLLDRASLPQFAVIASAGLFLLACVAPTLWLLQILVPAAGLMTYFFYQYPALTDPLDSFWWDATAGGHANLWTGPYSYLISHRLGLLFVAGAYLMTLLFLLRGTRPTVLTPRLALVSALGLNLFIGVWGLQPGFWSEYGSRSELAAFPALVSFRGASLTSSGASSQVDYPDGLVQASLSSDVKPHQTIAATAAPLFQQSTAGHARSVAQWGHETLTVARWPSLRHHMSTVWVEVLLGSHRWAASDDVDVRALAAVVGECMLAPKSTLLVTVGWAIVNYEVPAPCLPGNGIITFLPKRQNLLWNGSTDGPWIRVLPGNTSGYLAFDGHPAYRESISSPDGISPQSREVLPGPRSLRSYRLDAVAFPIGLHVTSAGLSWSTDAPELHPGLDSVAFASYALLVIFAMIAALGCYMREGRSPGRRSQATAIALRQKMPRTRVR